MTSPSLCKLMDASYAAARDLMLDAARELDAAAEAAQHGKEDLSRGTAMLAEEAIAKAASLLAAVAALRHLPVVEV